MLTLFDGTVPVNVPSYRFDMIVEFVLRMAVLIWLRDYRSLFVVSTVRLLLVVLNVIHGPLCLSMCVVRVITPVNLSVLINISITTLPLYENNGP